MASFRFAIAGGVLMTYCLLKKERQPTRKNILINGALGTIILVGGQGLLIWAEQYIASGYAAVIVSSAPIWYVLLDKKNRWFYLSNNSVLVGVMMGFIGIICLFYDQLHQLKTSTPMTIMGSLGVVISVICWVAGTLYHQSIITSGSIFTNLSWQLIWAAMIGLLISLMMDEFAQFSLHSVSLQSWLALLYLAIAGSIIAFVAYTWLLTQRPAVMVGTYAYINPIIAVFLGWLVADEIITYLQLLAIAIILMSAFIINKNK